MVRSCVYQLIHTCIGMLVMPNQSSTELTCRLLVLFSTAACLLHVVLVAYCYSNFLLLHIQALHFACNPTHKYMSDSFALTLCVYYRGWYTDSGYSE